MARKHQKVNIVGYSFVIIPFLVYLVFVLYPLFGTLQLSFQRWDGFSPDKEFVGIINYTQMWNDPISVKSFYHNLVWILLGTFLPIIVALPLAVILWSGIRGLTIFRTIFFMPIVLSSMIVGIIWGWIYNPVFGILNEFLRGVGLDSLARAWLGDPATALPAIIIASAWHYYGFCIVILLAGLQNVDLSLVDAAKVDGANSWQCFINIIIPQLREVLTMLIIYTLIGGFKVFDIVFSVTAGGPAYATELMATYLYKQVFQLNNVGYGSAIAIFLALLVMVVSIISIRLREGTNQ